MVKVLNIVFRVRLYRGCAVLLIISIMPFMLLPSTFPRSSPLVIEAQASLSTESINLSNSTTNSFSPQLAISQSKTLSGNDSVYVVWSDNGTGNGDIYFKRSVDNGTSFGSTQNLSTNPGNSTAAQIAAYQDNVYVVWEDATTGNGDIYFKRSVDNGTSFGNTENLSNDNGKSYGAQIVISGNNIYVVWADDSTGNGDIYFKRSVDNGTSFGSTQNLSTNPGNSTAAQIATFQDNVYVVWEDATTGNGDIYLKASLDNGTSFGNTENLSNNTSYSDSFHTAISGSNVYVVWADDSTGNGDIYFKRSVDNGTSFGNTENLSNDNGKSYGAQIVVSENNIYVVWADDSTGNGDIYFKRSVDSGTSFGSTQNLSTNPGNSTAAQIAAYQDNVYVVWEDATTGNGDIYFKRSVDNGTSFGNTENLSNNTS